MLRGLGTMGQGGACYLQGGFKIIKYIPAYIICARMVKSLVLDIIGMFSHLPSEHGGRGMNAIGHRQSLAFAQSALINTRAVGAETPCEFHTDRNWSLPPGSSFRPGEDPTMRGNWTSSHSIRVANLGV